MTLVEVDRASRYRLAKAISLDADIHMRVLYSDERDTLFGT